MKSQVKSRDLFLFVLLLPLLNACGQLMPSDLKTRLRVDESFLRTEYSDESQNSSSCRYNEVIQPDSDTWVDGTGYYSVCANESASSEISVYGTAPEGAKQYCVFPAKVNQNDAIFPLIPAGSSIPLMKCGSKAAGTQVFSFPGVSFNALFVVPFEDRVAMQACLGAGSYYTCPKSFSYGQFRN
ncbi:hypothetical protein EBZ37_13095 [bacterium]|nr:hypothetical protein [bacterium]